ncbi:MAG: ribonuclease P protein component [Gammaproteobacteria bacterium]|nr:ribonuclease P protein component [Gammaproteobacteria bacterium]
MRAAQRLRQTGDFNTTLTRGTRRSYPSFFIYYRTNQGPWPRLGLAVSKRVARKAVTRNRLKRALRETFRKLVHVLPPFDIVILLKPSVTSVSIPQLRELLAQALNAL